MSDYFWTAVEWATWDAKTSHLSLAKDGAYRRLLSRYYQTRKPLPANADDLLRICRAVADDERSAVMAVIEEFFTLEPDGYHNRRADEELAKQAEVSEKRREAGKLGAAATNGKRSGKDSGKKSANADTVTVTTTNTTSPINPPKQAFPEWLPIEQWEAYVEMRRIIGRKLTQRGKDLAIKKLEKFRNQGHDPKAILENSIFNSYQGLFVPSEDSHGKNQPVRVERISAQSARIERNRQASADLLRQIYPDIGMAEPGSGGVSPRHSNGSPDAVLAKEPVILPPRGH